MHPPTIRPRRSALYMPAINARAVRKAAGLSVDTVIFDLEDAVAPHKKDEARIVITELLAELDFAQRELVVRINASDSPWFDDDVAAVATLPIHAVALPKVESASVVQGLHERLARVGAPAALGIWPMIETPRGVLAAAAIAASHPSVDCLVMGTSDLAKELRLDARHSRDGLHHALSHCVLAARATGIDILDGVCLDIDDSEIFQRHCEEGRRLGFDGKTLIHPRQLDICNTVFGVSAAELDQATAIVAAWREAEAAGSGVAVVNGKLVESLHVDEAQRLIAMQRAIEAANNYA